MVLIKGTIFVLLTFGANDIFWRFFDFIMLPDIKNEKCSFFGKNCTRNSILLLLGLFGFPFHQILNRIRLSKIMLLIYELCFCKLLLYLSVIRWPSGESVRLGSCRLGFDSESGQTNDFRIGIHSFLLDVQH